MKPPPSTFIRCVADRGIAPLRDRSRKWQNQPDCFSPHPDHEARLAAKIAEVECLLQPRGRQPREVVCLNTGQRFASLTDAARALNVDLNSVFCVAQGQRSHTRGLRFAYAGDVQDRRAAS